MRNANDLGDLALALKMHHTRFLQDMFMFRSISFSFILGAILLLQLPVAGQEKGNAPSKELLQYIQDAQKAGLKDAQIQQNALKAGWASTEVLQAISYARTGTYQPSETKGTDLPSDPSPAKLPAGKDPNPTSTATNAAASSEAASGTAKESLASSEAPLTKQPNGAGTASVEAAGIVKPAVINHGVPDEYHIGEGDVVQVSVWGEPAASVGSVVVRPDGKVTIPLIKDIAVAGLTPAEAERIITEKLSTQIKAADVTVIVNQINSKKVFLVGAVKKEGPIPYTYRMTVMQALSEGGGLTDYAKRKKIYVLRNDNGRQYQLPFDYDAVLKGQRMELNIPLQPGDTLVVPH